jgi:hypothetical protein
MSFLKAFTTFCDDTEASPVYATYSGLVTLSAIVSRRIWLPMGHFNVYPNLYVVLVGPQGIRKSTAMDVGKGLIRQINKSRSGGQAAVDAVLGTNKLDIPLSAECCTAEKIIQDMQTTRREIENCPPAWQQQKLYSPMNVMVTELSELLKVGGQGMISFLTAIFDREVYDYRTKNKGQEYLEGPYLNLIACTTPEWINGYLREDVISGGFARRALFVFENAEGKRIPRPVLTDSMRESYNQMVAYADKLKEVKGPMTWTKEAETYHDEWYMTYKIPVDPLIAGYYRSKQIQLLKIATLLSISETTDLVITKGHLTFAMDILALMERRLPEVFAGIGKNELHSTAQKVLQILQIQPAQTRIIAGAERKVHMLAEKVLRANMFKDAGKIGIDEILTHLIETEKIWRVGFKDGAIDKTYIVLRPQDVAI